MTTEGPSGGIKSAYEKAMERVANLATPTKEKKLEWKGVPEGTTAAVEYLKGEGDLAEVLKNATPELKPHVLKGVLDVFGANIQLPRTSALQGGLDRVMAGLKVVFPGNRKADELATRIKYVCDQYRTNGPAQRQQVLEQLKREFTLQLEDSMRRQGGSPQQPPANVESLPAFQAEWQRIRGEIDKQYDDHLAGFRQELFAL